MFLLLIRSDVDGIEKAKEYIKAQFVTKEMGRPRYFLEIEIALSKHEVVLFQRKYIFEFTIGESTT